MVCEMSESGANLSDFGLVMRLLMSVSWPEHVVVHTFDKIIQHAVYLPH